MATSSIAINKVALDNLNKNFASFANGSYGLNALLIASEKSPYLAGLLNEFYEADRKFASNPDAGTSYNGSDVLIDKNWVPAADASSAMLNKFVVTIAHELGHATLNGGYGYVGQVLNPDQASASGRTNEGVALSAEYIVARQLGVSMYSDLSAGTRPLIMPQLLDIEKGSGVDISSITFGSLSAKIFDGIGSQVVLKAGAWIGESRPSVAPSLNYNQYNAAWWLINKCSNVDPSLVNWNDISSTAIRYLKNSDGSYSITGTSIPLKSSSFSPIAGSKLNLSCEIAPDGRRKIWSTFSLSANDSDANDANVVSIFTALDGSVKVVNGNGSLLFNLASGELNYLGYDEKNNILLRPESTGSSSDLVVFLSSDGRGSIGFNGNSIVSIPATASVAFDGNTLSMKVQVDSLTGVIDLTGTSIATSWSNLDGSLFVRYSTDFVVSDGAINWTQNGLAFSGGDLGSFITDTFSRAVLALSTTEAQTASTGITVDMGKPADGVALALGNAASNRTLAVRMMLEAVSDHWAPAFLTGQIGAGMLLSGSQSAAIQQALASIAQQQWQARQLLPSIITVTVLGAGYGAGFNSNFTGGSFLHPLVLDLSGAGVQLVAPTQSNAMFDLNADGSKEHIGWVGAGNGILVFDKNGNGSIDGATEWFGESFSVNGAPPPANQDGFAALATLVVTGATTFSRATAGIDPVSGKSYFDLVQIWVDANQDGITDKGELRTLTELGIASIDLLATKDGRKIGGGEIALTAGYTKTDGTRGAIADVGLAAQGSGSAPANWIPSTAALLFADYAAKGYAALSKGQAQGVAAALATNQIQTAGNIAELQTWMNTDRMYTSQGYPNALMKVGDRTKITMVQGTSSSTFGSDAGIAAMKLLQDGAVFQSDTARTAASVVSGAEALLQAQTAAQVANATGTASARDSAQSKAQAAATAWGQAIATYLNADSASLQLNARMEALRLDLNTLVPVNNSYTSHLPGGYTYFSPGDAKFAAAAFEGYANALQLFGNSKIAMDRLLSAMAQSSGYSKAYVGRAGTTLTVGNAFNLLLAGSGTETFVLGTSVDHVVISAATGTVNVQGFQTGASGDQLQFLGVGNAVRIKSLAGGGIQLLTADGQRFVNLAATNVDQFNWYANLTGVSAISFADFSQAGTRSIEGERLYDGQVHISQITASHFGDTLIGDSQATILNGGNGNDTFIVAGKGYRIDGGAGEDRVSYAKINGGVTVDLRAGTDSLGSTLFQVEQITGSDYRDQLSGDAHDNVFDGGKGYDTLEGGGGNDVYLFGRGDGVDTIINGIAANSGASSILRLKSGIEADHLWLSRDGSNLVVQILGANDRVVVTDWFAQQYRKLGAIELANGLRLDVAAVENLVTTLAAYQQGHPGFDPRQAKVLPDGVSVGSSFSNHVEVPQVIQATNVALEVQRAHENARASSGVAIAAALAANANSNVTAIANANSTARYWRAQVAPIFIPGGYGLYSFQNMYDSQTTILLTSANFNSTNVFTGRPWYVTTWRQIGALESDKIYVNEKRTDPKLPPPNTSTSIIEKTLGVDTILNNVDQVSVKLGSLAGMAQTIGSAASARQQALALAVQANTASDATKNAQARLAATSFESQFGTAVLTYQKIAGELSATANILIDNDTRLNGVLPADSNVSGQTVKYSFYSPTDASKVSSLQAAQAAAQSGYNAVAAMPSALLSVFASMGSWATAQFVGAGGTAVAAAGGELLIAGFGGNHILIGGAGRDTFAFVGGNGAALDTINNFQAGANGDRLLLAGAGNIGYFGENGAGWAQLRYASGTGYASVQLNGVSYQGLSLYDNLQGIDTADFRDMGHGVNIALNSVTPRDFDGYTHVRNVSGSAYGDTLAGDAQDNILTGGAGDDTLMGGSGNDTYIWRQGDGNDTIREQDQSMSTTSMDVLKLLDVNADQVSYSRSGNDLLVKILPTNEVITIRNQYGTLDQRVEVVEYANGSRRLLPVANTLPAGNVQIKSAAGVLTATSIVTQNDVLTATHNLIDPDGIGTMRYQWYANGELIAGAVAATFAPTQAEVGKQISVRLEYTDGFGTVEAVSSSPTAVVANKNDAPVGTVTINGVVTEGQTLTASHNLSDADGLGTVQYQWYADGVLIEGATAASLLLTELHGNKKISVKASYIDGFGAAESVSSVVTAAVAHRNRPVSGTVNIFLDAAAISADSVLKQGDILSVGSALSDPDGLGTLTYQWYADDQIIDGANGLQFVLGQAQVGKHISVKVSYVDGYGSAEAVTSQSSGSVLNVNDAPVGKIVIIGYAVAGKTLAARSSPPITDADGMGVLSYQWFADGQLIAGKTEDKLLLSDELIGKTINVEVSYIDGFGTAEKLVSVPTAIVEKAGMGTAGPDIFYGTPDADRMEGLGGDDTYYVNHPGDIVIEQLNGGNDTVYTSIDYVLADNVETMRLTKNGLTVSGNALNNSFLMESTGGNTIDGGGGTNNVSYLYAKSAVTATMQRPSSPVDLNFRGDKLTNIRNVVGSQFDDVLNGDDGANTIVGGAGNDILRGWGGDDVFLNNPGSDIYIFGRGDGADRIMENIVDPSDRNIISFVDDIRPDQLWFRRVANDMEVSIIGTTDKITIVGWFSAGRAGIQEFRTAGGYVLTEQKANYLMSVMATYAVPPLGQTSLSSNYVAAIGGAINNQWHLNRAPIGDIRISGVATEGSRLSVQTFFSDPDGISSIPFRYQWFAGDTSIFGATASYLDLIPEHAGKAISVQLSYVDSFGATESIRSTATLAIKPITRPAQLRMDAGESGTTAFSSNQLSAAMPLAVTDPGAASAISVTTTATDFVSALFSQQDIRMPYGGDAENPYPGMAPVNSAVVAQSDVAQLVQALAGFAPPSAAQTAWASANVAEKPVLLAVSH